MIEAFIYQMIGFIERGYSVCNSLGRSHLNLSGPPRDACNDGLSGREAPEQRAGAGEGADRPRAWLYLGASLASALAAAWLWGAGLRGAR